MIQLRGRLLFKEADEAVYSSPGENFGHTQCMSPFLLGGSRVEGFDHTTQALESQGGNQGFSTDKDIVFPAMEDPRGFSYFYVPKFGYCQRGWTPCQECLNRDCFSANPDRETYRYRIMEDVKGIICNLNPKDELRYKHITTGVHLFIPFLGHTYHFCNLQYILRTSYAEESVFMIHITRYILDAVWGRETYTVSNILSEFKINVTKCEYILKAQLYPLLVPHIVMDLLVMCLAVDVLMRSLDLGRLSTSSQFYTFRSYRLYFSTVWKASIKGVIERASLGDDHMRKAVLYKCITQNIWLRDL